LFDEQYPMVISHDAEKAGTTASAPAMETTRASSEPILSIIIPTYNNAQYLPQAIDSVISQNVAGCEIIVINDGSTDDTAVILTPYANQINYIYQENAGSAAARNTGLAQAKGGFVLFLDADDWLLPGNCVAQMQMLTERPSLGLVHSGWQVVDEAGEIVKEVQPWYTIPKLDLDAWVWHKPVQMGAMMFRREWLETVGGFDPNLRQSHDVDLVLRLALAGCTAAWLPQMTFCYRLHIKSTIRRHAPKQYRYLMRVLEKFFADERVPANLRADENAIRYYTLRWIAWHLSETGFEKEATVPLQDAWQLSSFSPIATLFDWAAFWRHSMLRAKRPLSSVWTLFQAASAMSEPWPLVMRLLDWWWHQDDLPEHLSPDDIWTQWQTAVAAESTAFVSAEMMLDWSFAVWAQLQQGDVPQAVPQAVKAAGKFTTCTPRELAELCKQSLVQQPEMVSGKQLAAFWTGLARTDLITRADLKWMVGLLLTLFGQSTLRNDISGAFRALGQAIEYTGRYPTAVGQWVAFLKTAVSYYQQRKQIAKKEDGIFLGVHNNNDKN
jgi:glycosyltransferase involved in cell wall biosynthesis